MADKKNCVRTHDLRAEEGGEPSTPIFKALGTAFGLALGYLALKFGHDGDVELALHHTELIAKATIRGGARPSGRTRF